MIPNNTIYEAGFKSQFFTFVLISGCMILGAWSLTKLIINLSKSEEYQKKFKILYQHAIDIANYYLDDLKYVENAIKFFQTNIRHKQVYESVAVEDGLLTPIIEKKTIYCEEYYQKVVEKQKTNKNLYSEITINLTLSNGVTLNYIPKYPWYWDGVELFNGIQPNAKKVYNQNYLSPDYVPKFNILKNNESNHMIYGTQNVKSEQEAQWLGQNVSNTSELSEEQKKMSTLLLTKNNNITAMNPSSTTTTTTTLIVTLNEEEMNQTNSQTHEEFHVEMNDTLHDFGNSISTQEDRKDLFVSISSEGGSMAPSKKQENNKSLDSSNKIPITTNHPPCQLKTSESTIPHLKNEKMENLIQENSIKSTIKKPKALPNLNTTNNKVKNQQKQKFLKKLKHKKQPKIIYPSIPVNPNLSFVPLYQQNMKDSKLEPRVKHSDMENTYKRLKVELQQKSFKKE